MRREASALLLHASVIVLLASCKRTTPDNPIVFAATHRTLGTVECGETPEVTFEFENVGEAPCTIDKVAVGCGCLGKVSGPGTYRLGERGKVTATVDTRLLPKGHYLRALSVVYGDLALSPTRLEVEFDVLKSLTVEPQKLEFGTVMRPLGDVPGSKQLLQLTCQESAAVPVTSVVVRGGVLETRVIPLSVAGAGRTSIEVAVSRNASFGEFRETLEIQTGLPNSERIYVLCTGKVIPFDISPSGVIDFGVIRETANVERELRIENHSGEAFQIRDLVVNQCSAMVGGDCGESPLSTSIRESNDSKVITITLTLNPKRIETGFYRASLSFRTDRDSFGTYTTFVQAVRAGGG